MANEEPLWEFKEPKKDSRNALPPLTCRCSYTTTDKKVGQHKNMITCKIWVKPYTLEPKPYTLDSFS